MNGYIHVRLASTHPHAGETGRIQVVGGKVTLTAPLGIGESNMVEVLLDDCQHGANACFARASQIELLPIDDVSELSPEQRERLRKWWDRIELTLPGGKDAMGGDS